MDSGRSSPLLMNEIRTLTLETHNLEQLFADFIQYRHGSVLTRNTILKSDHYFRGDGRDGCATNRNACCDASPLLSLMGGPNFRRANRENVYGVAQPAHIGLLTILALMGTTISTGPGCVWFSTREEPFIYINGLPFVLRDQSRPFTNIPAYSGISGERLGMVEARLKRDILREAAKTNNQLILVHNEQPVGRKLKVLVPTLVALETVQTPSEFFQAFVEAKGFNLTYLRVPIPREHCHIEDFIDELVQCFQSICANERVIFSCGMGVGRTTYGMVLGCLFRKIQQGGTGGAVGGGSGICADNAIDGNNMRASLKLMQTIENALGQQSITAATTTTTVQWMAERAGMMEDLMAAFKGNYLIIMQLVRVLEHGLAHKQLVDETIDQCDSVINIREQILTGRIQWEAASGSCDSASVADDAPLDFGIDFLERYFSLITFCAYLHDFLQGNGGGLSFGAWMREHLEIWSLLQSIRGQRDKLKLFRPISNLSPPPSHRTDKPCLTGGSIGDGEVRAAVDIVKSRSGSVLTSQTILKMDYWNTINVTVPDTDGTCSIADGLIAIQGAPNFRRLPTTFPVYATAQPTLSALNMIIDGMRVGGAEDEGHQRRICWINVREEPLVYLKGDPFVLRDQHATLRNIRSYKGITWTRLEQMELRLKDDILAEAKAHGNQILLHEEDSTRPGHIQPRWEYVDATDVDGMVIQSPREIFTDLQRDLPQLIYYRIPITAGETYQPGDIEKVMQVVVTNSCRIEEDGAFVFDSASIIFNCQCGAGRSTFGTVLALQLLNWMNKSEDGGGDDDESNTIKQANDAESNISLHYKIINGLLRVIPNGLACKMLVDSYIDQAGSITNLRKAIEECRLSTIDDAASQLRVTRKGIAYLKRYFMLIVFEAYLQTTRPQEYLSSTGDASSCRKFSAWFTAHQEFQTLLDELERHGQVETLLLEEHQQQQQHQKTQQQPATQLNSNDEAVALVRTRPGSVLAPLTILKYDHFPGCQKLSLPDRIEGAPNFRAIWVAASTHKMHSHPENYYHPRHQIVGVAMPTADAVKSVIARIVGHRQHHRKILWISLREEPVVFINGKPFVLRVVKDPVTNLEMTGIVSERVEMMEERLKGDILAEMASHNHQQILVHDEVLDEHSQRYVTLPSWEPATEANVQTPFEVFTHPSTTPSPNISLQYARVPVTDEQAPVPAVFDRLLWLISQQPDNSDLVFNCQMGRGRTTTAMVIAKLYLTIKLVDHHLIRFQKKPNNIDASDLPFGRDRTNREIQTYLNGNYRLILQLVPLLEFGKLAKRLTDNAIDNCSHIQNLREAIYEYKLLLLSSMAQKEQQAQSGTRRQPNNHHNHQPIDPEIYARGINYLVRYAYLIVFTNYLLEECASPHFWQAVNPEIPVTRRMVHQSDSARDSPNFEQLPVVIESVHDIKEAKMTISDDVAKSPTGGQSAQATKSLTFLDIINDDTKATSPNQHHRRYKSLGNNAETDNDNSDNDYQQTTHHIACNNLFIDWLRERREIQNLLKKASEIGFE